MKIKVPTILLIFLSLSAYAEEQLSIGSHGCVVFNQSEKLEWKSIALIVETSLKNGGYQISCHAPFQSMGEEKEFSSKVINIPCVYSGRSTMKWIETIDKKGNFWLHCIF